MEARWALSWWRVFLAGLGLWIAAVAVTALTRNLNLVPTVVLLGSFLVPVTAVLWYLDHYDSPVLTGRHVLNGFLVGGVLGVLGASLLETWLPTRGPFLYLIVGLIEEGAKLVALVAVTWRLPHRSPRDGVVMGAAVGFGFAALESSGYALTALVSNHLSLTALVETELVRGVLAPLGHGLWTGILGGVLFAAARGGGLKLTWGVVVTYLGVSLLHALWDGMFLVAALLTVVVTGPGAQAMTAPGPSLERLFVEIALGGYAAISIAGIVWLAVLWRRRLSRESWAGRREVA